MTRRSSKHAKQITLLAILLFGGSLPLIGASNFHSQTVLPPSLRRVLDLPQADLPPPTQFPGEHSTLTTKDGHIRDDELADYICSQIPKVGGVPQVHDVKIMFNSCYGGGMIDDIARVFGPGGACAGVPWVASSASQPDRVAYGPPDDAVNANPSENLGSFWSNALKGAIKAGGNVQSSFEKARNEDKLGPNGSKKENPVIASGNGGSAINWDSATNHRAVVFGGKNNRLRHDNNIENISGALQGLFGSSLQYIGFGWGDASTGTKSYLQGIISAAASGLDSNTQLVLYFDDHGDTEFDFDEFMNWQMPMTIDPSKPTIIPFSLHQGWPEGLVGMTHQGEPPEPVLLLNLETSVQPSDWTIMYNAIPLSLPLTPFSGEVFLPIPWEAIVAGPNNLLFLPDSPTAPPLILLNLELQSGPINELEMREFYLPLIQRLAD